MNKKLIRLTESDLHDIVKKSLKRALSETADHNMAVDDKKYFDSDESWKAKKYQDERDKFLTNPNYVGTPSLYDPMNYREVEDFVDDEEDGFYKDWMDKIGYEGATNNDSIYNIKGDFSKLANKQREHLLNQQTKPWLHNESKKINKKLVKLTESDLHRIVKESVNRIINEVGNSEDGQRALGALAAAKFKGKKKGDWGEVAKKASDERDKAVEKAAKSGHNKKEPWSSLKAWHKKRTSMSDAYNDGYQKQVNESGFYPMEYDSKIGYYTPNGTVNGVDTYIDFDDMSFNELNALRNKYLEQVGHTPWNKIAKVRPDIFQAVNAIEDEMEERRERYREGDESAFL